MYIIALLSYLLGNDIMYYDMMNVKCALAKLPNIIMHYTEDRHKPGITAKCVADTAQPFFGDTYILASHQSALDVLKDGH